MRKAVRAIVIHEEKILVMYRNKFGTKYATLPGGGVDPGESLEVALIREMEEETNVLIAEPRLVFIEEAGNPFGTQYVYLCKYVSGEPSLSPDSEEYLISKLGLNTYEPAWATLNDLRKTDFVSLALKTALIAAIEVGFAAETVNITG